MLQQETEILVEQRDKLSREQKDIIVSRYLQQQRPEEWESFLNAALSRDDQLTVRFLNGECVMVKRDPLATIQHVKDKVAKSQGLNSAQDLKLFLGEASLNDGDLVATLPAKEEIHALILKVVLWDSLLKEPRLCIDESGTIVSLDIGVGGGDNPHLCAADRKLSEVDVTIATLRIKQAPTNKGLLQICVGDAFPGSTFYSNWISRFQGVYIAGDQYGGQCVGTVTFEAGDIVQVTVHRNQGWVHFLVQRGGKDVLNVQCDIVLPGDDPRIYVALGGASQSKIEVQIVSDDAL